MKVIGLDLGSRTCGISISDASATIAMPAITYRIAENNLQEALDYVKMFVKENDVSKIVLGLPMNMNGTIGPQAQYCLKFKEMLEAEIGLEVVMIDERMTSIMANDMLISADMSRRKRKETVDKVAATIILQSYLDSKR